MLYNFIESEIKNYVETDASVKRDLPLSLIMDYLKLELDGQAFIVETLMNGITDPLTTSRKITIDNYMQVIEYCKNFIDELKRVVDDINSLLDITFEGGVK